MQVRTGGGGRLQGVAAEDEEPGWGRDKKSVIGAINENCVMMALLQTLPTAALPATLGGSCNGFCPLVLAAGKRHRQSGRIRIWEFLVCFAQGVYFGQ